MSSIPSPGIETPDYKTVLDVLTTKGLFWGPKGAVSMARRFLKDVPRDDPQAIFESHMAYLSTLCAALGNVCARAKRRPYLIVRCIRVAVTHVTQFNATLAYLEDSGEKIVLTPGACDVIAASHEAWGESSKARMWCRRGLEIHGIDPDTYALLTLRCIYQRDRTIRPGDLNEVHNLVARAKSEEGGLSTQTRVRVLRRIGETFVGNGWQSGVQMLRQAVSLASESNLLDQVTKIEPLLAKAQRRFPDA